MRKIDYVGILQKAFKVTFKSKMLFVLGALLVISSVVPNWNFKQETLSANVGVKVGLWLVMLMVTAGFIYLKILSTVGLIKIFENMELYRQVAFKKIMTVGKEYAWRLFGLELVANLFLIFLVVILALPVVKLFVMKASVLAWTMAVVAGLIMLAVAITVFYLEKYAYFYIVLGNMAFRGSLEKAYELLSKNLRESLLMGVVLILLSCASVFVLLASGLMLLIPLGMVGLLVYYSLGQALAVGLISVCLVLTFLAYLVFLLVFKQAAWLYFFQLIALKKKKDTAEENVVEVSVDIVSERI